MATKTVKKKKSLAKSEQAYEYLRTNIQDGHFTPGYRLVLASIADELGMSVVPVREAIRRLEAEGLVTFERNVGACVKMVNKKQYAASMDTLAILEGAATAQSAPKLSAEEIAQARAVNETMKSSLENFDALSFTNLNQRFHALLMAECPNERLMELVRAEWIQLGNLRDSTFSFVPSRARESVREHVEILKLIETGAPAVQIEEAVRNHRAATVDAYLSRQEQP